MAEGGGIFCQIEYEARMKPEVRHSLTKKYRKMLEKQEGNFLFGGFFNQWYGRF